MPHAQEDINNNSVPVSAWKNKENWDTKQEEICSQNSIKTMAPPCLMYTVKCRTLRRTDEG